MSLSAIFRFENLDSTKDLNDLYQYLFNKGVYWWDTTSQTNLIVASGASLNVTVAPFRALSYDGMHILSDSSITLSLSSSKSYKIVCKAKYLYEDTPYIKVSAMTEAQISADPESEYYIVLADVSTAAVIPAIDFSNADLVSEIGYNPYKGYYDSADEIETTSLNRAGDFCFVSNPSGDPAVIMHIYSGNEWVSYGDTESIATNLTIHKANGDTEITPVTKAFNSDGVVGTVYDPGCLHVSLNMLNAMRWFGADETPASRTNRFVTQSSPYALTVSLQGACVGNRPSATNPSGAPSATNPFVVSNTPIAIETDIGVTTSASEPNYIALPCVTWNGSSTTASPGFYIGFGASGTAQEYFDLLSTSGGVLTNSAGEVIAIEGVYTKSGSVYTEIDPSSSASAYGYWWQNGASLYLKVGKSGTGLIDSSGTAKVKCYIRSSYGLGDIAGDMSSSNIKSPSVQRIYKYSLREFGAIHFDSAKSYNIGETTVVSINPTTIVFNDTATTNYVKENEITVSSVSITETETYTAGGSQVNSCSLTKNILSFERTSNSQAGAFSSHIYLNNPSLFECYYSESPSQSPGIVNTMRYSLSSGTLSVSRVYNSTTYSTTIIPGSIAVSNPAASTYPGSTTIEGSQISLANSSRIHASGALSIAATQVSIETPYLIATTTNVNISATASLIMNGSNSVGISSHAVSITGSGTGGTAILSSSATSVVGTSSVTIASASVTITGYEAGHVSITGPSLSVTTVTTNINSVGNVSIGSTGGAINIISSNNATLQSTNGTAYVTGDNVTISAEASSSATLLLSSTIINIGCRDCTLIANSTIDLTAPTITLTSPNIVLSSSTNVSVSSSVGVGLHIASDTHIYLTSPTLTVTSTTVNLSTTTTTISANLIQLTVSNKVNITGDLDVSNNITGKLPANVECSGTGTYLNNSKAQIVGILPPSFVATQINIYGRGIDTSGSPIMLTGTLGHEIAYEVYVINSVGVQTDYITGTCKQNEIVPLNLTVSGDSFVYVTITCSTVQGSNFQMLGGFSLYGVRNT